ncbi:MAG: type IVB secretion system protein IcmH/DotU, partial [Gammaproteobacteria bacterium]|nr:type IVB secretion system protein IcmH/DotU [Gammaproteobacteria bacterium]
ANVFSIPDSKALCDIQPLFLQNKKYLFTKNRLLIATSKLFSIINQLKHGAMHTDVHQLKHYLLKELRAFQSHAEKANYDMDNVLIARFLISATLDEFITRINDSVKEKWMEAPLLKYSNGAHNAKHNFFIVLERLCHSPEEHIDLIELAYICLSLGYEGMYKTTGHQQELQNVTEKIYQIIRNERGDFNRILHQQHAPSNKAKHTRSFVKSFTLTLAFSILMLTSVYAGLSYLLNFSSQQINQQITQTVNSLTK